MYSVMKIIELKKELETTKYIIEVDNKVWQEAQAKAKKDLLANVTVPGFRKGHVPEDKANITEYEILSKAVNGAVDRTLEEF